MNFKELETTLNETSVDHIFACHDVDIAYEHLHNVIDSAVIKCTYETRQTSHDNNVWFDKELIKLRARRQMLYHKYIKNTSENNKISYDEVKKSCASKKRNSFIKLSLQNIIQT